MEVVQSLRKKVEKCSWLKMTFCSQHSQYSNVYYRERKWHDRFFDGIVNGLENSSRKSPEKKDHHSCSFAATPKSDLDHFLSLCCSSDFSFWFFVLLLKCCKTILVPDCIYLIQSCNQTLLIEHILIYLIYFEYMWWWYQITNTIRGFAFLCNLLLILA